MIEYNKGKDKKGNTHSKMANRLDEIFAQENQVEISEKYKFYSIN